MEEVWVVSDEFDRALAVCDGIETAKQWAQTNWNNMWFDSATDQWDPTLHFDETNHQYISAIEYTGGEKYRIRHFEVVTRI